MSFLYRRQCAGEIASEVTVRASRRHGVAHDPTADLQRPVRSFIHAFRFNPPQGSQKLDRLEIGDRASAEPRKDVVLQPANELVAVTHDPSRRMQREPFPGDGFESVRRLLNRYQLLGFALLRRIDSSGYFAASLVTSVTGLLDP